MTGHVEDPGATLTCRMPSCGAVFPLPPSGGRPWYCEACRRRVRRDKQWRKEQRRQARRLADPEWIRKPEVLELARTWRHTPVVYSKVVHCATCGQVIAHRRGPAKGGWWGADDCMSSQCPGSITAETAPNIGVRGLPGASNPLGQPEASVPPQRPYIAPSNRAVKLA